MKKFLALLLFISFSAFADSSAVWTCTGKNVVLKSVTPYMGEERKWTQTLFILKKLDVAENDNAHTAFFLDVEHDVGKYGTIHMHGKNEVGGEFYIVLNPLEDVGDGTIIRYRTSGTLEYVQGPTLTGKDKVKCTLE